MSPSALLPEVKIDRLHVVAAKVGDAEVRPQYAIRTWTSGGFHTVCHSTRHLDINPIHRSLGFFNLNALCSARVNSGVSRLAGC